MNEHSDDQVEHLRKQLDEIRKKLDGLPATAAYEDAGPFASLVRNRPVLLITAGAVLGVLAVVFVIWLIRRKK